MDKVYEKQLDLINKYKEICNSDNPSQSEIVDVRQEMARGYHIMNHNLRGNYNMAGRYVVATIGGTAGYMIYLSKNTNGLNIINRSIFLSTFVLGGTVFGYFYGRRYHSRYAEGMKNQCIFNEFKQTNDPIVEECDNILRNKMNNKV